jgi:hypothetical protein
MRCQQLHRVSCSKGRRATRQKKDADARIRRPSACLPADLLRERRLAWRTFDSLANHVSSLRRACGSEFSDTSEEQVIDCLESQEYFRGAF